MSATVSNGGDFGVGGPTRVHPWFNLSGYFALFTATVRRLLRVPRLVSLGLLFLMPTLIVLLAQTQGAIDRAPEIEFAMMFVFVPTAIVPFTALIFASGLVQDEVEEQTLTYLMMRPIPRASIYVVKLLASVAVTAVLATVCTVINEAVIYAREPIPSGDFPTHVARLVVLYCVTLVAYNAIFGLVGLFFKKSLPIGVAYIILFEGVLATIPFVFRKFTVVYYFRALAEDWFGGNAEVSRNLSEGWAMGSDAPDATTAILTLLSTSLVCMIIGGYLLTVRELRVKTPETT